MAAVIPVVTRLSNRIIRILGCNPGPMTLQGTNTYIIGTGRRRMLIDTGEPNIPQYLNALKSLLNTENINLSHIFISHWHRDHIGGLTDILANLKQQTIDCQIWKYRRAEDNLPENTKFEFCFDGQEFSVEGATLKILYTPGHTNDHICFHLIEENALFSADCILGEGTAVFEDLLEYMKSLKNILQLKPSIVYPGHGNIVLKPEEKIEFYIKHREERERQILQVLSSSPSKKYTELDLVKIIYVGTPENLHTAAALNINHHLVKLSKESKAEFDGDGWRASSVKCNM